jgi:hypothetical protein
MATAELSAGEATEVSILGRLFVNGKGGLTPARARDLLDVEFSDADKARMHELAVKNQEGRLAARERDELLGYAKAGCLLGILHSQARRALKKSGRRSVEPHPPLWSLLQPRLRGLPAQRS